MIKPCPFCKCTTRGIWFGKFMRVAVGFPRVPKIKGLRPKWRYIECQHCGASGPKATSKKEAVELWNRPERED